MVGRVSGSKGRMEAGSDGAYGIVRGLREAGGGQGEEAQAGERVKGANRLKEGFRGAWVGCWNGKRLPCSHF